jgi:two-component system nitrogen regulation sensor histidine kinase GlnL
MSPQMPPERVQILESLATAVLAFDDRLRLVWMNSAAEELLALGLRQAQGRELGELFPAHPELSHHAREVTQQRRGISERELKLLRPDGSRRTADLTLSPLALEGGEAPGVLLEATPSDRRTRIAQEGRRLEEQRALRRVVRGLTHEVKNPLGGLRGAAQLLERHLPDPALTEYTDVIQHEVERLLSLLNRLQSPRQPARREWINIHQVLERVRTLLEAEAPSGIAIVPDYDPSLPELRADFDQLVQVFLNLGRNAVQALQARERGRVTLRTRVERHYTIAGKRHPLALRVEVADNGPGIPPEEQSQIFYPLVTSRAEGTGLGLSLAQDLVTAHGGVIDLHSRPGATTFQVILPLEPDEADNRQNQATAHTEG